MMRFSQETIEKVREACDVVEVVGEHVSLKKSGQNFKGLCPFHSERTPSFTVSPAKQVYHCFGCGAGGNVISFVMQVENLSFVEAVRSLASRKGIELPRERSETDSLTASLLSAMEYAVSFYKKELASPAGKKARDYLAVRGVEQKTQEEFSLGHAPGGWDGLSSSARKYFPEAILVQAGLLVPRESGSGVYDRFRDRLMFPILSAGGRAIGFGGRAFDESQPKYINSSDSPIFQKGSVLYGLYQAKRSVRARESALVVEGYMDLLSLYQSGFQHVVASCGTAFTPEQAKVLRRYTSDAVLIYDGDEAGINAARRALRVFVDAGLRARLVCLPSGHDPDSFVRKEGREALEELVEGAWSVTGFVLRTAPQGMNRENNIRSLIEVYALIDDPIYRRIQIQEGSEGLRFDESTIAYEVDRLRKKALAGTGGGQLEAGSVDRVERELVKLILENESLLKAARESLSEQYFKSGACREAFVLLRNMRSLKEPHLARLLNATDNGEVRNLLSSVMLEEDYGYEEPLSVFADYVRKLRMRWLNESIKSVEEEIKTKEASSDAKEMRALLSRLQELVVERSSLNGAREEALG
jgi:DNA primase